MSGAPMKCPKCKGKGFTRRIDPLLAVLSLGLTALMDAGDRYRCDGCNGKGWVRA